MMTKSTSKKIQLGIFVVLASVFLVIAAYMIGNNQDMFSKTFSINTVFSNVNGLQIGNNVRFSGINVGTVKAIEMENDTTIRVRMSIEEKMQSHIKKDAIATIGSDGLVGNMIINIIPGKDSEESIQAGDEIVSYSRIGTEDMLSTLSVTNENAAILTADLLKVTQSLTRGKGTMGRLLNDTVMANDLQQTILNLKHASSEANSAIKELNDIIKEINFKESIAGVLLSDSITGEKVQSIVSNLETSSVEIDKMSKSLNSIVTDMKDGHGAVNYLSKDTTLVGQLGRTMQNIEEGTARFNENMEALKHNFLFRRYFRKLEKEQKKKEKVKIDQVKGGHE
ncbi:MlaD family protein [Sungkyunkwania multivorans]|uniref:MlaD family protein n=1 Tax=Sungkyunkwania multivorans TaxID=1173618 RepID=A0ABW3D2I5_9FLAO